MFPERKERGEREALKFNNYSPTKEERRHKKVSLTKWKKRERKYISYSFQSFLRAQELKFVYDFSKHLTILIPPVNNCYNFGVPKVVVVHRFDSIWFVWLWPGVVLGLSFIACKIATFFRFFSFEFRCLKIKYTVNTLNLLYINCYILVIWTTMEIKWIVKKDHKIKAGENFQISIHHLQLWLKVN